MSLPAITPSAAGCCGEGTKTAASVLAADRGAPAANTATSFAALLQAAGEPRNAPLAAGASVDSPSSLLDADVSAYSRLLAGGSAVRGV